MGPSGLAGKPIAMQTVNANARLPKRVRIRIKELDSGSEAELNQSNKKAASSFAGSGLSVHLLVPRLFELFDAASDEDRVAAVWIFQHQADDVKRHG